MRRQEIEKLLPIRDPYLWVDEVIEISSNQIHARKHLNPDLDLFQAHYIDFPVFPGAMQCECAFQAAGVLIAHNQSGSDGRVPVIASMKKVRFRGIIRPDDTLDIHVELTGERRLLRQMRGSIQVGARVMTQLEFSIAATNRNDVEMA